MMLDLPEAGAKLVVDTEGSGLYADDGARVSVISWAWRDDAGDVHSNALPFGQGPEGEKEDAGPDVWGSVLDVVQECRVAYHNAAHDLHQLNAGSVGGYPGRNLADSLYWDTLLGARFIEPLESVSLENACVRNGVAEPWKNQLDEFNAKLSIKDVYKELRATEYWGAKGMAKAADAEARRVVNERNAQRGRYDRMPWDTIYPYATDDAVNTLLLLEWQEAYFAGAVDVPSAGWRFRNGREHRLPPREPDGGVFEREMGVCGVLYRMEERGVGFDAPGCAAVAADLMDRMAKALAALPSAMKNKDGVITPQALCRFYYDDLGFLPTKWHTKENRWVRSADEFSRRGLRDQGAPLLDELEVYLKLETALTSWYGPWPERIGPDGRLRMRVRQAKGATNTGSEGGVVSGRFSGERVNLMAIPHDRMLPPDTPTLRSFIHAAPGKELYEIDLSQAEVRVGCVAAQCAPLMEEYRRGDGADVYALTALELFGVSACPVHGKGGKGCEPCAHFSHYRDLCKRLVLGTLYSMGAKSLVVQVKKFMGIDIPEADATEFLGKFREQYPEFKRAERRWMRYAEDNGYVPLALGDRRYFQPYEYPDHEGNGGSLYKALNQRIQGSVAVGMKVAMVEADAKYPGVILLQIHDSLVIESSNPEHPALVARIMEDTFNGIFRQVPFTTEVKVWH